MAAGEAVLGHHPLQQVAVAGDGLHRFDGGRIDRQAVDGDGEAAHPLPLVDRPVRRAGAVQSGMARLFRGKVQRGGARPGDADAAVMHVVVHVAQVVLADGEHDVVDFDGGVEVEHGLHVAEPGPGVEVVAVFAPAEPLPAEGGLEVQVAGVAEPQGRPVAPDIPAGDRVLDVQAVAPAVMGEMDVVAGQRQVVRGAAIMEPHADADDAGRQVAGDMHEGVDPTPDAALDRDLLQPRMAGAAQDERAVAEAFDEPQHVDAGIRVAVPERRDRQEFQDLRVVVGPEPAVAIDRLLGLGDSARGSALRRHPLHQVAQDEFGIGNRVGGQVGHRGSRFQDCRHRRRGSGRRQSRALRRVPPRRRRPGW